MKRGQGASPTGLADEQPAHPGLDGAGRPRPRSASATEGARVPARAEGVTLIGEFEQSGFEEPPSLVRRKDGQVVQLTQLLYLTLEAVDGRRDLEGIAAEVSRKLGRTATAENVRFLLDEKLRPLGLLENPDGSQPETRKASPLLALRWKVVLSGERLTNRLTAPFAPLFRAPVVALAVAGFVAVCAWVLFGHGVAQGTRQALYSPGLLLTVFALTVFSAGFHEFGHAAACHYGGAQPGVMGAGIYLVWPAFYTDVTDAYRLNRRGRLRTDLGGLYFNAVFVLATFGAWAVTRAPVFLVFVPLQIFEMLHQLLPVVRMDGYHILSDLTGVPDLFARVKPTLVSAVPGMATDEQAAPLKRWVRVAVTAWVLVVVPLLLLSVVLGAISLPRVAATAWDSLGREWEAVGEELSDRRWVGVLSGVVSIVALLLPIAGSTYMLLRFGRRSARRVLAATADRPVLRGAAVVGMALSLAGLAWLWWPNGEYEPISPREKGTLTEGFDAVRRIDSGRPGLTEERVEELGVVPDEGLDPTDVSDPGEDEPDETPSTTVAPAAQDRPATTVRRSSTTTVRTTPTTVPASDEEEDPTP